MRAGLLVASLALLQQAFSAPGRSGEPRQSDHTWCHGSGACYSVHLASRNFSGAQEACSASGGALSTASGEAEIQAIFALLRQAVAAPGPSVFWLGLVRKPSQCTYHELPLRGFSWAPAGLQETRTNDSTVTPSWAKEPSMSCTTEKCAGLQGMTGEHRLQPWGLKERSCAKTSPGYICKYRYGGTCPALQLPGAQSLRYTLPSRLQSADLAFSPPGTVLTLRCLTREARLTCQFSPDGYRWEGAEPGLCSCLSGYWSPSRQQCVDAAACRGAQGAFLCVCTWGFHLAADERSCLPAESGTAAGPHSLVTPTAGGALPSSNTSLWNQSGFVAPSPSAEANSSAPDVEAPLAEPESSNYIFILVTLAVVLLVILVMTSLQVFKSCFKSCSFKGAQAGKELAPVTAPEGDPEAFATRSSSEHSLGPSKAESTEASQGDPEPVAGKVELEQP